MSDELIDRAVPNYDEIKLVILFCDVIFIRPTIYTAKWYMP